MIWAIQWRSKSEYKYFCFATSPENLSVQIWEYYLWGREVYRVGEKLPMIIMSMWIWVGMVFPVMCAHVWICEQVGSLTQRYYEPERPTAVSRWCHVDKRKLRSFRYRWGQLYPASWACGFVVWLSCQQMLRLLKDVLGRLRNSWSRVKRLAHRHKRAWCCIVVASRVWCGSWV